MSDTAKLIERLEQARTDFWSHTRMDRLREAADALTTAHAEIERLTRERDEARILAEYLFKPEEMHELATKFTAAEAEVERLTKALDEVRGHFIVEYHGKCRTPSIGHDSQALPKIIALLDAARALDRSPSVEPGNG